jgi:hypothetical protein
MCRCGNRKVDAAPVYLKTEKKMQVGTLLVLLFFLSRKQYHDNGKTKLRDLNILSLCWVYLGICICALSNWYLWLLLECAQ